MKSEDSHYSNPPTGWRLLGVVVLGTSLVVVAEQLIAAALRSKDSSTPHIPQWGEKLD